MLAHSDLLIPHFLTLVVSFFTGSNKSSIQSTFLVAFSFVIVFSVLFIFHRYSENTDLAIQKGDRVSAYMN